MRDVRHRPFVAFLLSLAIVGACSGPDTLVPGDIAIVDVTVIPMDSERALEGQMVVVEAGRITAIGSVDDVGPEDGVEVIDGDGLYLIPGLTEMHGHLPPPRMSDIDIKNLLFLYLANGVTTVRGMQGDESQFSLRAQVERGLLVGPRFYLGSVSMNGGNVATPEQAEQRVREYSVAGYDLVKVHEGLSRETFDALARIANEVGMPFGGHVPDAVGLRHALASGQRSIDHLDNYLEALVPPTEDADATQLPTVPVAGAWVDRIEPALISELVAATVAADAWVVPTMVLWETAFFADRSAAERVVERPEIRYMPPETVEQWRRAVDDRLAESDVATNQQLAELRRRVLQALHQGGANIALGTDSPQIFSVPGFAMHREMALYAELGMTPYEVLEIATRKPAEYFDATDDWGTVAVGQRADVVLLRANPLDDIANLTQRAGVLVNGRWFPEDEIQRRLEEMALFYGN